MNIQGSIYLSSALAASLGVPVEPTVNIRAGHTVVLTRLVIKPDKSKTYILSPELRRSLCLNQRKKLQLRCDIQTKMLHIGPVIGIFATGIPNYPECAYDSIQAELIFLSKLSRTLPAQIYIFTPYQIDWAHKLVRGFTYQSRTEGGTWHSALYPLPDVVYDRIASRKSESSKIVKDTKKKLMSLPYLKYFNYSFLNKWRVHQMLINNEEIQPYLPETKMLNSVNLADMLQKHSTLFLKPTNGSLGRGIIKLTKNGKHLKYTVYRKSIIHGMVGNHLEFMKKTRSFRNGKPYIIQQGIDLITHRNAPFDIRIIYQRNGKGEWQVAKKFVRVAPQGSSISNLSSGGYAEKLDRVFGSLYSGNKLKIEEQHNRINNLCQLVAAALETAGDSIYGELGLDIGIDKDNFPWLIEVNSKPRKSTTTRFSQGIVRNSFKRPLEYAIYLAGFKNKPRKTKK